MRVPYSTPVAGLSAIRSQTFQHRFGEYGRRLIRSGYHPQVARLHLHAIVHFGVWLEREDRHLETIALRNRLAGTRPSGPARPRPDLRLRPFQLENQRPRYLAADRIESWTACTVATISTSMSRTSQARAKQPAAEDA
jgi:hypothetical protein